MINNTPPLKGLTVADLFKAVDNGTTVITIATPKGWYCSRSRCKIDYLHSHGTYQTIRTKKV